MEKLSREHFYALRNSIGSGGRSYGTEMAKEALEILDRMTKKPDVEIAAQLQGLSIRQREDEYINDEGVIFVWTEKGFKRVGQDFEHMEKSKYCTCPYPKDHELHNKCEKCDKELL
jgi:hypothetical protein